MFSYCFIKSVPETRKTKRTSPCLKRTSPCLTNILNNVSGNNIEYVKSQLEKLDDNIMEYMHYLFEKYYRNGFCDAVELISGCLR